MPMFARTITSWLLLAFLIASSLANPLRPKTYLQQSSNSQSNPLIQVLSLKSLVELRDDSSEDTTDTSETTSDDTTTDDSDDTTTDDSDDTTTDDSDDEEAVDGDEATDVVFEDFDLVITSFLSDEENEACVEWFDTYDVDDDEELSGDEFATGCAETFGYSSDKSALYLIIGDGIMGHQYKDGQLMIYELETLYNIYLNSPDYQQVEFVFFAADSDIDGNLTEEEFEIIQSAFSDEYDLDFDTVDTDGSGGISVDELLTAFGVDYDTDSDPDSDSDDTDTEDEEE